MATIEIPDDELEQPASPPPVAVVRRRGESNGQLDARKAGYSDAQIGYDFGGRRSGESPLARSARLALDREKEARLAEGQDARQALQERRAALEEQRLANHDRLTQNAIDDRANAERQVSDYLNEEELLAQKYGRSTKPFVEGSLALMHKYPAALMSSAKLADARNHYIKSYELMGGHPDLPMALWEVGQFNPSELPPAQARQYLGELAGKYPAVSGDKAFSSAITDKASQVALIEARTGGLVPKQSTIATPGASVVMAQDPAAKPADPLKMATQIRGQIRSLEEQARGHDKAVSDIEKDVPAWLNSTGLYTDEKGVKRFGYSNKLKDDPTTVVTPKDEAAYNRYQSALKAREELSARLPQLNQQLDDVLNGNAIPQSAPTPSKPGSAPNNGYSEGYNTADDVRADLKSGKLKDFEAEYILRKKFGVSGGEPVDADSYDKINAEIQVYHDRNESVPEDVYAKLRERGAAIQAREKARGEGVPPGQQAGNEYASAEDVRAAYKAGTLSRDEAKALLQTKFGHN